MKQNHHSGKRQIEIIKSLFIIFLIFSPLVLKAQTLTNFSGSWEFDKARSDKDERGDASFDGIIILEINQTSDTITFTNTFFLSGKAGKTLRPDSYLTNGTVTPDASGIDPAKKFVEWSQDKKIITTNYVMTATIDGEAQDFLTAKTYKLEENGNRLVVEEFKKSKLNGEKTIKKIYLKK